MRDDKVVLFADYLPAGTYEYVYTFFATQPGEYQVIPTSASEFYFPEVFGRADGRLLVIEEAESPVGRQMKDNQGALSVTAMTLPRSSKPR
jgi:hypothetical protein